MKVTRRSASHGEAGYEIDQTGYYPTEPWVTHSIMEQLKISGETFIWEPACGDGRMSEVIYKYTNTVFSSDLYDHGYGETGVDFLKDKCPVDLDSVEGIITNPPYTLAVEFLTLAVGLMKKNKGFVAMIFRHEFDAPAYHHPYFTWPFKAKFILPKRPMWIDKKEGEQEKSARFPYAWYVWDWKIPRNRQPTIHWLKESDQ